MRREELVRGREELEEQLRSHAKVSEEVVKELEEKVLDLQEELQEKEQEVQDKEQLMKVGTAAINNVKAEHQNKVKEYQNKLYEFENKFETMETFEKFLIQTMLNPDVDDILEIVEVQKQKILALEVELKEREEETNTTLEEKVDSNPKLNQTESILKLKGINISLVRQNDNVQKSTPTNITKKTFVDEATGESEGEDDVSVQKIKNKAKMDGSSRLANLLRSNKKLNIQKATVDTKILSEEEDEDSEEEQMVHTKPNNIIEEEKRKRREKRQALSKEVNIDDGFWFTSSSSSPESKVKEVGRKEEEQEEGEWKKVDNPEECVDCLQAWVHMCLEDVYCT